MKIQDVIMACLTALGLDTFERKLNTHMNKLTNCTLAALLLAPLAALHAADAIPVQPPSNDASFVQPDGTTYRLDQDYFGAARNTTTPAPGPFEFTTESTLRLKVWPK
jgi:hypothetical protein